MRDLVIFLLVCMLFLLWVQYLRLKGRVGVFEAADKRWPFDTEKLGEMQRKVGEVFESEHWSSPKYQEVLNFWFGVSELINYWCAVHPSAVAADWANHNEAVSVASQVKSKSEPTIAVAPQQ